MDQSKRNEGAGLEIMCIGLERMESNMVISIQSVIRPGEVQRERILKIFKRAYQKRIKQIDEELVKNKN